eukprot:15337561-Ditylum_brightwellii.AAC.1
MGSAATVVRESNNASPISWKISLNSIETTNLTIGHATIEYVAFDNTSTVETSCMSTFESPTQSIDWCHSLGECTNSCIPEHKCRANQDFVEVLKPRSSYSGYGSVHAINAVLCNMVFRGKKDWNSAIGGYASVEVTLGNKHSSRIFININILPRKDPLKINVPPSPYIIKANEDYSLNSIRLIDPDFASNSPPSLYELFLQ